VGCLAAGQRLARLVAPGYHLAQARAVCRRFPGCRPSGRWPRDRARRTGPAPRRRPPGAGGHRAAAEVSVGAFAQRGVDAGPGAARSTWRTVVRPRWQFIVVVARRDADLVRSVIAARDSAAPLLRRCCCPYCPRRSRRGCCSRRAFRSLPSAPARTRVPKNVAESFTTRMFTSACFGRNEPLQCFDQSSLWNHLLFR
jgi:hypothetical protein